MYEYNNSQSSWDQLGGGIDPIGSSATEDRGCFGWSIHMNADVVLLLVNLILNLLNLVPNVLDAASAIRP